MTGDGLRLSRYDEFPVHQTPYPVACIPSTDLAWDDGYYVGIYSQADDVFLYMGIRVSPNTNRIGAYAGIVTDGTQYTVRLSRSWSDDDDLRVGPLHLQISDPFQVIRTVLQSNDSDLSFDFDWLAVAPAVLEGHHRRVSHGRRTTDQTRYTQSGTGRGWIKYGGREFEVEPTRWFGTRDHSWGIYRPREPLLPTSDGCLRPSRRSAPLCTCGFRSPRRRTPVSCRSTGVRTVAGTGHPPPTFKVSSIEGGSGESTPTAARSPSISLTGPGSSTRRRWISSTATEGDGRWC